jgi:PST family polysaccharide transporter
VPANVLTLTWYFQGQEQMKYITWLTLGSRAWFATGLFLLVRRPEHFVLIPALSSSAEIVAGIVGIAIARKRFGLRFRLPGWQDLKEQMRLGWHVFVSTVAINGYTSTPTLAVGWFGGSRAAGYYSVAEKLAAIYQTFPLGSLLQAMYPRLSKIHAENPGRSYRLMRKAQAITTVAYAVTYPLVALLAPLAVRLITGKYVPEMQTAFAVMALATVGVNANAFHLQYLLVSGRHSIYSRLHVGMGLAGSGLVFLAAYFFTYLGPPWALIVINFAVLALTLRVISSIRRAEGLA